MEEMFGNLFHGMSRNADPTTLPFIEQCLAGISVFETLYVKGEGSNSRITGSPSGPVSHRVNPLLLPGSNGPVLLGTGPTVDIRREHLEVANLTATNSGLITGRTLLRSKVGIGCSQKGERHRQKSLGPQWRVPVWYQPRRLLVQTS